MGRREELLQHDQPDRANDPVFSIEGDWCNAIEVYFFMPNSLSFLGNPDYCTGEFLIMRQNE